MFHDETEEGGGLFVGIPQVSRGCRREPRNGAVESSGCLLREQASVATEAQHDVETRGARAHEPM